MNQAMLAKAGWRIMNHDQGLWSQMFRKKYLATAPFPQGYSKPAPCSHVWSSIVFGSSLLSKGLRWRVGNGAHSSFWSDHWTKFGILSDHATDSNFIDLNAKVCSFWCNGCWILPKLSDVLPPNIVDHICAIPISNSEAPDSVIWDPSPNGIFSVKSAFLLNFPQTQTTTNPWLLIWKMSIPPKMRVFLWTIMSKKLLTNIQRKHRKFTSDDSCFHCFGTPENLLHLFRNCPKAMLVWSSFYIPPVMAATFHLDWNGWLYANLLQNKCFYLNIPWNVLFAITCWHIWKWRCNCIFDSSFNLPYDMKAVIFSYAKEWLNATRKKANVQVSHTMMLRWIRPPPNFVKINVDGSLNRLGSIGAGGIMRDPSGSWISGFMISLGSGDILTAEAWGLFYGIQLAIRCGHQNVIFESDSKPLISLLTDDAMDMHPLGTIIMNCQSLAKTLSNCSFRHVHREKNYAADFLAKASLGNVHGIIWLNACPPALVNILLDDMSGTAKARRIPAHRSCFPPSSEHVHGETSSQFMFNGNVEALQQCCSHGIERPRRSPAEMDCSNNLWSANNIIAENEDPDGLHWRGRLDTNANGVLCRQGRQTADTERNLRADIGPMEDAVSNLLPSSYG